MKKEIVINASKDRSRIAIVEDGELVELYVEHPDNVRTLGNIYLGRIRKIMPAIKAAFVDIGQKQDAFLHFSDLTENLPELLAIAGEPVPGYEPGYALSHAPQKRVADDESEPDVEEKLDFDSGEEPQSRGRGGRARARGRGGRGGRTRGGRDNRRRREEEEEQEEQGEAEGPKSGEPPRSGERRASPFVIDLTMKPGKLAPPSPEPAPERAAGEAATAEKPPRRRSPGRKRDDERAEATAREAEQPEVTPETAPEPAEATPEAASETGDEPRRRRRGRRGGRRRSRTQEAADTAAEQGGPAADEAADVPVEAAAQPETEEAAEPKPRRAGRTGRRKAEQPPAEAEAAPEAAAPEAPPAPEAAAPAEAPRTKGRGGRGRRTPADREAAPAAPAAPPQDAKAPEAKPARSRKATPPKAEPKPERAPAKTEPRKAPTLPDRPEELLRRDGRILVKISKEPISAKGSRVSTDISLAGRFLVLVPAADYVAVSKKIESARERRRLKTLATSLKPDGFGVIVRTVAEDRDAKTLDTDLSLLLSKWRKIEKQLASGVEPPVLLYEDVNMVSSIIRDLFTEDYDRILVDDPRLHKNIKAYVQAVAPHMAERVQLHRSNTPIFRAAGLEKAVEQVFSTRVPLPSGGYLFIEHTEAMHVVDVNSGRAGRGKTQAENLLAVNLEAAREVAKQLRLRDLGGIIVVDFIDMRSEADRRKVYQALKEAFKKDRAVTKLLPMSDFGLIEITRQRLRPSITAQAASNGNGAAHDPAAAMAAAGAAEIPQPERDFGPERLDAPTTTEDVVGRLEGWLRRYRAEVPEKYRDRPIAVRVHPLLAGHLRRGFPSLLTRWRFRLRGLRFTLDADAALHPLEFEVRDEKSGKPLRSQYEPAPPA
ncbi:MAG TPA: Rne/Rng family ribonuclease [Rubricoccaceae bacterium]|nr:Rne/Rng family ribonuclease [Rubricoccaceae bacterium]